MQIPDVNVLIDAWHPHSKHHEQARIWLEESVSSPIPLGLSDMVLSGVLRILTNRKIPTMGARIHDVLKATDDLRRSPGVVRAIPGARHWQIFSDLCHHVDAAGDMVPDCYLAALAMENNATFVSRDQFFSRVPGLDWIDLPGA